MAYRKLLTAFTALISACALALTGCAGPLFAASSADGTTVVFANTGGTLAEIFAANAYPELESAGMTVAEESPNNEAKLTAMVQGGNPTWDVYYSTPYNAISGCGTLFEELDLSRIDTSGLDRDQVSDCGVPIIGSAMLLVYNKAKYGANPPTGWADFFDTTRFPGTRGIMNFAKDAGMETALLADGVPGDQLYPLDYDRAFDKLDQIRSSTRFYTTGAQQTQGLESGEIDMMLAWPGRAYDAAAAGTDLGVAWDEPLLFFDAITIVKGARNLDGAYDLINALMGQQNQQAIADRLPYQPMNSAAHVSDDPLIREFVNGPQSRGTAVERDNNWWAENRDEATRKWTEWVNQ
ncbi:extracellular solute-binding protein [soil metagenome]